MKANLRQPGPFARGLAFAPVSGSVPGFRPRPWSSAALRGRKRACVARSRASAAAPQGGRMADEPCRADQSCPKSEANWGPRPTW